VSGAGATGGRADPDRVPWPDAVLFDLDGTLVDSLGDLHAALDGAHRAAGLAGVGQDDVRRWVGRGAALLVARSLETEDARDPRVAPLLEDFLRRYRAASTQRTQLCPGVSALLERLQGAGVQLAVTTNKPHGPTRELLAALGVARRFEAVVCPELVGGATKPDRALFDHALELLGDLDPGRVLVVGDGLPDVQGARAAGVRVAAVLSGYGDRDELLAAGADHYLQSTAELGDRLADPGSRRARPLALVVEDNPELLRMYASMLERAGFRVLPARAAGEALALAADHDPDLLVLDGELPDMHGAVLFAVLERRLPGLAERTLMVTGLASSPPVEHLCRNFPVEVLEKPFRSRDLLAACRRRTRPAGSP
jgi:phosphoglycolate phosphatase